MWEFFQAVQPIHQFLSRQFNGPYYREITRVKGGTVAGTDWISKYYQSYAVGVQSQWTELLDRFSKVKLEHLWEDNWCRVFLLNGVERLVSMRQAHSVLPSKFVAPSNNNIELSKALSAEGGFNGWFKGSLLSAIHFTGVFYPALYLSNSLRKQNTKSQFLTFGVLYMVFDLIMLPIDRLRTLSYVNLGSIKNVFHSSYAYSGALLKAGFNFPYLWALNTTVKEASTLERVLAWGSVALAYPLLTLKTQSQIHREIIRSPFLPKLYAGLMPFMLMNVFVHWNMKNLYAGQTKEKIRQEIAQASHKYDRKYQYGRNN